MKFVLASLVSATTMLWAATLPTTSVSLQAQDVVWDATRSLFWLSVGAGDTKWPSSVVMVNPETAQIVGSISTVDPPDHLTISADGSYLYVGIDTKGVIRRYHLPSQTPDFDIPLVPLGSGGNQQTAAAIAALPGQDGSILVAQSGGFAVYDGTIARSQNTWTSGASSVYIEASSGQAYGYDGQQIFWLTVGSAGVSISKSAYAFPAQDGPINWGGGLATGGSGCQIFSLSAGVMTGKVVSPAGASFDLIGGGPLPDSGCALAPDPSGASVLGFITNQNGGGGISGSINRYSTQNLQLTQSVGLSQSLMDGLQTSNSSDRLVEWGSDGVLIWAPSANGRPNYVLSFAHTTSALVPVTPTSTPTPTVDAAGAIHVPLAAGGLVFDPFHNVLWASVLGSVGVPGNSVVPISPTSGVVGAPIFVGSEPGALALAADGRYLFAALTGAPLIIPVDLQSNTPGTAIPVLDKPPANEVPYPDYWFPTQLITVPGNDASVVALRTQNPGSGEADRSLVLYNNSTAAPQIFNGPVDWLASGDSSDSLFGLSGSSSLAGFKLCRLVVGPTGVTLGKQLDPINLYLPASADVYANGMLFTSDGTVWKSDTKQELGSVPLSPALPVIFPSQNFVVYVSQYGSPFVIAAVDTTTFRPISITEAGASDADEQAFGAVPVGGRGVAYFTATEIVIVPLSILQAYPVQPATFQGVAPGVRELSVPVNAVSAWPGTSELLVTTPSADGNLGNSILTIDPVTASVVTNSFVGSEPSLLAAEPDGSSVFTFLAGSASVARLNLISGVSDLQFSTDFTAGGQAFPVWDMALGPDGGLALSYPNGALAIFDNGVPRPQIYGNSANMFADAAAGAQLAFDSTGANLYGYYQTVSDFSLGQWSVSAAGPQFLTAKSHAGSQFFAEMRYAGGLLYDSGGYIIDPVQLARIGRFSGVPAPGYYGSGPGSNHVWPDTATGRIFFVAYNQILVYDMTSMAQLGTMQLPYDRLDFPAQIVKYSGNGLAIVTMDGELYLVDISAIPLATAAPKITAVGTAWGAPVAAQNTWLTIQGTNLVPPTTVPGGVFWSNAPEFAAGEMPTSLNGVHATVNGKPAYVEWFCSGVTTPICGSDLVNILSPLDSATGPVPVVISSTQGISQPFTVTMQAESPTFPQFGYDYAVATHADFRLLGPTSLFPGASTPAQAEETVLLFGFGFGLPTNPVVSGSASQTGQLPVLPVCTIGSFPASVAGANLISPGLYQLNVVVPNSVLSGNNPVNCTYGGFVTPLTFISVQ